MTEQQLETLRRAMEGRITAPHDDGCSWIAGGVCTCGLADSEQAISDAMRPLVVLTSDGIEVDPNEPSDGLDLRGGRLP